MPDEPMVKCIDCGFLAMRALQETKHYEKGEIVPLDEPYRNRYQIGLELFPVVPLCFMRVRNFQFEYDTQLPQAVASRSSANPYPESELIKELVSTWIECGELTEWQLGSTPKEHREM